MIDSPRQKPVGSVLRGFLSSEASGGIVLMAAAALALVVANSPLAHGYHSFLHLTVSPALTPQLGPMTVHVWINDGLMAVFFLLVGLEIKREFLDGRLSSWSKRTLPAIAAAAGMAVPALIYLVIAGGDPRLRGGWAIPAATDIAFAIGVLALLGSRAPAALKLFLTTVAIVDDLGAVAIIAVFYTSAVALVPLLSAAAILVVMWCLGRAGVRALPIFMLLAVLLWYAILLSGVHATVAGVLAAAMIPLRKTPGARDASDSPLHRLEHRLSPIVAFVIVPLFGFANAGVTLGQSAVSSVFGPLPLAIAAALFLGKQVGIFGAMWLCVRLGFSSRLRGTTWLQTYGVALLCGIGFTMSLFIGALAFPDRPDLIEEAKIGVLLGSLASAVAGYVVLRLAPAFVGNQRDEALQAEEFARDNDVDCPAPDHR